jgi:hypothetical protein
MKNLLAFCIIATALFAASCEKSSTPDTGGTGQEAPFTYLREDNKWTYINSDTDPAHAGITFESSYYITSLDPHGYWMVDFQVPGNLQKLTWYSDTSQWADNANKSNGDMFTLIKSHPVSAQTYSKSYTSGIPYTVTRTVMSTIASKTVPAGTFTNCVLIHETKTNDADYYTDYWIHPTYGIIRMEGTKMGLAPVLTIQELKEKPF